ncbi:UNVERIFIED_CONTAM: hypothetical protein HDU68_010900 [Siphonaria sp. JEL0065]|nr:hypothetical protein HDU68_010900 [Siphonaria sp. JEL0065]
MSNETEIEEYDLAADQLVIIHGALMGVAWVFLAPAGIAAARFFKHVDHVKTDDGQVTQKVPVSWFRLHYIFFGLCFLFNMIAFGLIYVVTGEDHFDVEENGLHVVSILLLSLSSWNVECVRRVSVFSYGLPSLSKQCLDFSSTVSFTQSSVYFTKFRLLDLYNPKRETTPLLDHIHHWFGRGLFILCLVNIPLGINLYAAELPEDMNVSNSIYVAFYVWIAAVIGAFIFLETKRASRNKLAKEGAQVALDTYVQKK